MYKTGVIILAAGDGKRMNSDTPKVMTLLHGKPLIDFVVRTVEEAGASEQPVVVVSKKHTLVQEYLRDRATYAVQAEPLGTGHATGVAREAIGDAENVAVLYGDMPFLRSASLARLIAEHTTQQNVLTLLTVTVPDFAGPYAPLYYFGRVIRDDAGNIVRSVELKDATPAEAMGKEVNPCFYCFRADWLWRHVDRLKNENAQREFYLTDLVQMAIDEREPVSAVSIDPSEAIGINTKEDLALAHGMGEAACS